MGGIGIERSDLILGFAPLPSNVVTPLGDYESHIAREHPLRSQLGTADEAYGLEFEPLHVDLNRWS
jgi:hypothetical protein